MISKTLGAKIREIRKSAGLTQVEAAQDFGCAQSLISSIENDDSQPSIEFLAWLAENTGTSLDWLITGKKTPTVEQVAEPSPEYVRGQALSEDEKRFVTMLRRIPQTQKREILDRLTGYYIDTMEVVDGGGGEEENDRAQGNG
jgi:transcriptional regulator with XRE-family HTH domain